MSKVNQWKLSNKGIELRTEKVPSSILCEQTKASMVKIFLINSLLYVFYKDERVEDPH